MLNLPTKSTKLCPLELFSNALFPDYSHLQRTHVFVCPVYVLDPKLQDAKQISKWKMRSRRGIYLGISKDHSSTVHLILNLVTYKVSPQYHFVFDDHFSTVASNGAFNANVWDSLVMSNTERSASIEVRPDGSIHVPSDYVPFEDPPPLDSLATLPTSQPSLTITPTTTPTTAPTPQPQPPPLLPRTPVVPTTPCQAPPTVPRRCPTAR